MYKYLEKFKISYFIKFIQRLSILVHNLPSSENPNVSSFLKSLSSSSSGASINSLSYSPSFPAPRAWNRKVNIFFIYIYTV